MLARFFDYCNIVANVLTPWTVAALYLWSSASRQMSLVEVLVQLLSRRHVGPPPQPMRAALQMAAHLTVSLMTLASPAVEFCNGDQPVGQGAPQQFGGNQCVAAALEYLIGVPA